MRQAGMSDAQLDTLLSQWQRTFEALTRTLNGWVFSREIRIADGDTVAFTRTRAAESIRFSWQQGVTAGRTGEVGDTLSLRALRTGDLPALNLAFDHIRTLDLTGVRLTAQGSNEFLGAFTRANRLILSGNQLSALPDAVAGMTQRTAGTGHQPVHRGTRSAHPGGRRALALAGHEPQRPGGVRCQRVQWP